MKMGGVALLYDTEGVGIAEELGAVGLDLVAPAAGEEQRVRLLRRSVVREQPVLVAVAIFKVEVEEFGVEVMQQLDGGGDVEADLPGRGPNGARLAVTVHFPLRGLSASGTRPANSRRQGLVARAPPSSD